MRNKFFFLLILVFLCCAKMFSQTENEEKALPSLSETERGNAEENKIKQPFSWTSAGDALKYEIEISRLDEKTGLYADCYFHETTEEETELCQIYIEPLLPPGHYRSRIRVFNILGMEETELTSTDEFTVRRAFKPEVRGVSYPLYMRSVIYLDDMDNDGIIEVSGRNLFACDETRESLTFTDYALKGERKTLLPEKVISHDDERNREIRLQFDMKKLDVGIYHLFAQDASGLHSEENGASEFTVKFKKWIDLDIEAGYVFPLVLHDDTFPSYFERTLPLSAQARISLMPFKRRWGYLGLGVRASYSRLFKEYATYTIDGNLGTAHLLFVYQLPLFRRRVIAEVHGGAGLSYFHNMKFHFAHGIDSPAFNSVSLSFDAGLSAQIYINKRLYTEFGADYVLTANKDMVLGMLLPSVGIGWQF